MTSIEQDPINEAEEFEPDQPTKTAEQEYAPVTEVDPLSTEANPVDVAEQAAEVPLDEERADDAEE